jgi:hypothetical protein
MLTASTTNISADEKKKKMKKEKKEAMLAIAGGENISHTELEETCPVIQTEQNSARINPAENDSISQNEKESKRFDEEFHQKLSVRTISPELLEANKIIAQKEMKIEQLDRLLNERSGQSSSLFLPNNLTKLIRQFPSTNFILKHNGYEVTSVQPARKDEMSAAAANAAARLSQTGTSNNNQIQQQSKDDSSSIIHQQYKDDAAH